MTDQTQKFACPLCGSGSYKKIKVFDNGVIVGKCTECNLFYTPLRDSNPEALFNENNYEIMRFLYLPVLNNQVRHFRYKIFRKYLSIIKKYSNGKSLLDVGCAHGFFTKMAQDNGFVVSGIEPSLNMHRFAVTELGLDVKFGIFDNVDLNSAKFDVITFTDSFEYFPEALPTLVKIEKDHLSDSGIVFIKVPNGNYFNFRHSLKAKLKIGSGDAEAFSPSKRVAHYTAETLKKIIEKSGLELLAVKHIAPIDSPVWTKYTGLWLEFESPFCLAWKQKLVRRIVHFVGQFEYFFTRKNHFSQSVYVVAKRKAK